MSSISDFKKIIQKVAKYVNNKELLVEIIKSKEQKQLTPEALKMLMMMTERISTVLKYKIEEDRQDCIAFALEDIIRYWDRFDPSKSSNPFAFYTQIIKNGLAKGWRRLYPIKSSMKVTISREGGVYNF